MKKGTLEPEKLSTTSMEENHESQVVGEISGREPVESALPSSEQANPKRKGFWLSRAMWIVVGLVILNIGMLAGSFYLKSQRVGKDTLQTAATTPPASVPAQSENNAVVTSESPKTLHYTAKELKAEFDYPVDWRVQQDSYGLTLTSSQISIKDADGVVRSANIVLAIHSSYQGTFLYEEDVAKAPPEQLTYTNPASGQVPRTYTSFFGDKDMPSGKFRNMLIGGSFNYQQGQRLKDKNYKAANPFVELYIQQQCDHCQGLLLVQLTLDTWHSNEALGQARAVIASMRFN